MANAAVWLLMGAALSFGYTWYLDLKSGASSRVHNFSAGPGTLPVEVLQTAQRDLLNFGGTGMSFMELSHRDPGGPVQNTMAEAEANLRSILNVPDDYAVIFLQGGAHAQFAAVAMNLIGDSGASADYVVAGYWSHRAMGEGAKQGKVRELQGVKDNKLLRASEWGVDPKAAYVHICASETIDGYEYLNEDMLQGLPPGVPVVADFTSTLLSRRVDVSKYGVIYASGGKNLGPAGFAVVIAKRSLITERQPAAHTPSILNYNVQANTKPIPSIYNTPPTYVIYLHSLMLKHVQRVGGLVALEARAIRRAELIYKVVDESQGFYRNDINPKYRSRMNVPMRIGDGRRDLEKLFVKEAEKQNMFQLFGHPVRGGLRVTLYIGVTDKAVDLVAKFMREFAKEHRSKLTQ